MPVLKTFIASFLIIACNYGANAQQDTTRPFCGFGTVRAGHGFSGHSMFKTNNPSTDAGQKFIIPVVVHVIHNGGVENISDNIVRSQIVVLNEDYGYTGRGFSNFPAGGDPIIMPQGGDAGIRFCLATIDPDGNPTTGIEHIKSPYTNITSANEMLTKGLSVWDPKRYLNIWVVKSIDGNSQEQGYAYLASDVPGLSEQNADGIVVTYRFFGRFSPYAVGNYKYGRTTTHESGHYFDLMHTWGGDQTGEGGCNDDDGVDDTPDCDSKYYSSYKGHITDSCDDPKQCGYLRLIQDYMDYSEDACMDIFTKGQIHKMRQAILKYRFGLVTYQNAIATGCVKTFLYYNPVAEDLFDISPNPASGTLNLYPHFVNPENCELFIFDAMGRQVTHISIPGLSTGKYSVDMNRIANGMYNIILVTPGQTYTQKLIMQRSGN